MTSTTISNTHGWTRSNDAAQTSSIDDRRQFARTPPAPDEDLAIVLGKHGFPAPCSVIDEGKGGICVCVESAGKPVSGEEVGIIYRGVRRQGHIRHTSQLGDSQWKLGIAWAIPVDDFYLAN